MIFGPEETLLERLDGSNQDWPKILKHDRLDLAISHLNNVNALVAAWPFHSPIPLILHASNWHAESIIHFLIENGADLKNSHYFNGSCLYYYMNPFFRGHNAPPRKETVMRFIEEGVDLNAHHIRAPKLFKMACFEKLFEFAFLFASMGCDMDFRYPPPGVDWHGFGAHAMEHIENFYRGDMPGEVIAMAREVLDWKEDFIQENTMFSRKTLEIIFDLLYHEDNLCELADINVPEINSPVHHVGGCTCSPCILS